MNKLAIRMIGFLLGLFTFIMVYQNLVIHQQKYPFQTTEQFVLPTAGSQKSKTQLIIELNELTDRYHATLVKTSVPTQGYKNQKDILYFGHQKPQSQQMLIKGTALFWLDGSLKGKLIPAEQIGNRPLYGDYAVTASPAFQKALDEWAMQNGLQLQWQQKESWLKKVYLNLLHWSVGNILLSTVLLFLSALLSWFVGQAKARNIRFLGGVSVGRIHWEDSLALAKLYLPSYLVALIGMCIGIAILNQPGQLHLLLIPYLLTLLGLVLFSFLLCLLVSFVIRPKVAYLAVREIPFRSFRFLSVATRVLSILVALMIVPSTLSAALMLKNLAGEYQQWEKVGQSVTLSWQDFDSLLTEEKLAMVDDFLQNMVQKKNVSLSFAVDTGVHLSKEEYGEYDHLILTDASWLRFYNIGIGEAKAGGELIPIAFEQLDKPIQHFINGQFTLWIKDLNKLHYYTFKGKSFLALPQAVGVGNDTIYAKHPLVILIDEPFSNLKTKGFTMSMIDNGNVIFTDEQVLRNELANSPLNDSVRSIDTIAETALSQAQQLAKEALFYAIACLLILISMVFAGILTAQLWMAEHKKRLFTLHTFGKTYHEIISGKVRQEAQIVFLTVLIGAGLAYFLKRENLIMIGLVGVVILVLYTLSHYLAYRFGAKKTFERVASRTE